MSALDLAEINVFALRMRDSEQSDRLVSLLSPAELSRLDRLRQRRAQHRYIVSHAFLRLTMAMVSARQPAELDFSSRCMKCGHATHGKPRLTLEGREVLFNMSHSRDVCVVATSATCEIGVDVELVRPIVAIDQLDRLLRGGSAGLATQPRSAREVLADWCHAEAYLKGVGVGIAGGLDDVCFDCEGRDRVVVRGGCSHEPWVTTEVDLGADVVAVVAAQTSARYISVKRWSQLCPLVDGAGPPRLTLAAAPLALTTIGHGRHSSDPGALEPEVCA